MAKRGDDLINAAEKGLVDRVERLINVYGADVNHVPSDQPPPPITKPTYVVGWGVGGPCSLKGRVLLEGSDTCSCHLLQPQCVICCGALPVPCPAFIHPARYHGRTALIAAAEYGHPECCVKLVHLGAEITLVDS
jgi:hypothetical protein